MFQFNKLFSNLNDILFLSIIRITGILLRFALLVLITKYLNIEEFGIYSFVIQIIYLVSFICLLGSDQYLISKLPTFIKFKDNLNINRIISSILFIILSLALLSIAILLYLINFTNFISYIYYDALLIASLLILPQSFIYFFSNYYRVYENIFFGNLLENIFIPLLSIIIIYFFFNFNIPGNSYFILSILIFIYYISILIIFVYTIINGYFSFILDLKSLINTINILIPLSLFVILYQVFTRIPLFYIGLYIGPKDVAFYTAASRIADFIEFPLTIITLLYNIKYSALDNNDYIGRQNLISKCSKILFLSSFSIYILFIIFGKYIFQIWSNDFTESYAILCILGLAFVFTSVSGFVDFILIRNGHIKGIIHILFSIILLFIFILFIYHVKSALEMAAIYFFFWITYKFLLTYYLFRKNNLISLPFFKF